MEEMSERGIVQENYLMTKQIAERLNSHGATIDVLRDKMENLNTTLIKTLSEIKAELVDRIHEVKEKSIEDIAALKVKIALANGAMTIVITIVMNMIFKKAVP